MAGSVGREPLDWRGARAVVVHVMGGGSCLPCPAKGGRNVARDRVSGAGVVRGPLLRGAKGGHTSWS